MSSLFGSTPQDLQPRKGSHIPRADASTTEPKRQQLDALLTSLYQQLGITLDALPYTQHFETLFAQYRESSGLTHLTRKEVFHRLHNLRKAGKMPRLGRTAITPMKVSEDDEATLKQLVIDRIGGIGQRDQLPYDPRIDDLAQAFNTATGRSLTQADIWRLIAKIAK